MFTDSWGASSLFSNVKHIYGETLEHLCPFLKLLLITEPMLSNFQAKNKTIFLKKKKKHASVFTGNQEKSIILMLNQNLLLPVYKGINASKVDLVQGLSSSGSTRLFL